VNLFDTVNAEAEYRANRKARVRRNALRTAPVGRKTIQERFEAFDASNPEVWEQILELSRTLLAKKKSGKIKYVSISMIFEYMRMQSVFDTRTEEPFKLCNDFRSRYVRKLMAHYPDEFDGAFRLREIISA
jgi:hypothetical protein